MNFEFKVKKGLLEGKMVTTFKKMGIEEKVNAALKWYAKDNFSNWKMYLRTHRSFNLEVDFTLEDYAACICEAIERKVKEEFLETYALTGVPKSEEKVLNTHAIQDALKNHLVFWLSELYKEERIKNPEELLKEDIKGLPAEMLFDFMCEEDNHFLWEFFDKESYKLYVQKKIEKIMAYCVEFMLWDVG